MAPYNKRVPEGFAALDGEWHPVREGFVQDSWPTARNGEQPMKRAVCGNGPSALEIVDTNRTHVQQKGVTRKILRAEHFLSDFITDIKPKGHITPKGKVATGDSGNLRRGQHTIMDKVRPA
jgi:hypothetical protein